MLSKFNRIFIFRLNDIFLHYHITFQKTDERLYSIALVAVFIMHLSIYSSKETIITLNIFKMLFSKVVFHGRMVVECLSIHLNMRSILLQAPGGMIFPDRATLYITAIEDRQYKDEKINCKCSFIIAGSQFVEYVEPTD